MSRQLWGEAPVVPALPDRVEELAAVARWMCEDCHRVLRRSAAT